MIRLDNISKQNYKSRAIVDFDAGEILVETLDEQDPHRSLKNAVVRMASRSFLASCRSWRRASG